MPRASLPEPLQESLIELLVRQLDSTLAADVAVHWAVQALEAGLDTPALVVLAGFPYGSSIFEINPWLEEALKELHIDRPRADHVRRGYVTVVSRAMLEGTIACDDALELIHRRAVSPLGHPADLMPWCYVWERLAPANLEPLDATGVVREAAALAAAWAQRPLRSMNMSGESP